MSKSCCDRIIEKYRDAFENIGVGVAIISKDRALLSLNSRMKEWFPHDEYHDGSPCHALFALSGPCTDCPSAQTLRDGKRHQTILYAPSGGSLRHFKIISTPLRNDMDTIMGTIEVVEDITEQINNEEELHRHRDRLEDLIRVRTRALENLNDLLAAESQVRREALDALRETEKNLRTFLDAIQDGAYLMDTGGRIIETNQIMAERFNTTIDRLAGSLLYDYLTP